MKILPLLEERKLLAVVYGGRFQPFHRGHYAVYKELCKAFGVGAVWIATSNKTNFNPAEGDISPFTFEERVEIMTQLFGISPDKIIKCKNPAFVPKEVLELYKAPVVCVMVAGDKDVDRYSKSKSFKLYPLEGDKPVPFSSVTAQLQSTSADPAQFYYYVSHAQDGAQSGTKIRDALKAAGDDVSKQHAVFKRFYGKHVNDDVLDLMVSKVRMIKDPPPKKEKPKSEEPKAEPKKAPKASKKEQDELPTV